MSRFPSAVALVICLLAEGPALAAEDSVQQNQLAVERGQLALQFYEAGQWDAAYGEFASAEALAHSPVFLLHMARCLRNMGQLVRAKALIERVLRDDLPTDAPVPWQKALTEARSEREALVGRVPVVRIALQSPLPVRVDLFIDGRLLPGAELPLVTELDPGKHVVVLRAGQNTLAESGFVLAEGEKSAVVELSVPLQVPVRAPVPIPPLMPPIGGSRPSEPRSSDGSRWEKPVGYAAMACGVLAIGVGVATGWSALHIASEVRENCLGNDCLASDADRAQSAYRLARASTLAFVGGASALAAGGALVWLRPFGSGSVQVTAPGAGIFYRGQF